MSANQPLGGVRVTLDGSKPASTMTDANGNYTFSDLLAGGSYTITPVRDKMNFTPPNRSLADLRQDESADFSVLIEVYKISGRVMDAGQSLAGIKVRLEGSKATSTTTDGGGYYTFNDLRAGGNYTITPVRTKMNFTPLNSSFNSLTQDGAADFVGLNEREPPPPSLIHKISGRVTNAGQSLAGVKVRLEGSKVTSTTTDGSGYYAFSDLRAGGNYTITPVRARMNFTPLNRSFNNLTQDGVADFVGLGERDPTPVHDSKPASECTEADEGRERQIIMATYEAGWRRNIERERRKVIAENTRDGEVAEANLGQVQPQITFFKECKGATATVRYVWQINTFYNGKPARVLNVPRQRTSICGKMRGGWFCS